MSEAHQTVFETHWPLHPKSLFALVGSYSTRTVGRAVGCLRKVLDA
jgi:hypothetical protein